MLNDGEDEGSVEIPLPLTPLTNEVERVNVILESPVGGRVVLADEAMATLEVTHDVGK